MSRLLFTFLLFIYALLYYAKSAGIYWPVLSSYGADLLCLPIVLSLSRFIMIKFRFVESSFELSIAKILVAALSFAVVFELVLPEWSETYHSDYLDIVAYFLGGFLYYGYRLYINKKSAHEIAQE